MAPTTAVRKEPGIIVGKLECLQWLVEIAEPVLALRVEGKLRTKKHESKFPTF